MISYLSKKAKKTKNTQADKNSSKKSEPQNNFFQNFLFLTPPQKLFLTVLSIFVVFQIWSAVVLGIVIAGGRKVDILAGSLFIIVFVGGILAWYGYFNNKPPFHQFIYPTLLANLILSFSFNPNSLQISSVNYFYVLYTLFMIYLLIRYPIPVSPYSSIYRRPKGKAKKQRFLRPK